jgi:FAD:protein FMN transferase
MRHARHSPAAGYLRRRWAGFGTTVELRLWPHPGRTAAGVVCLVRSVDFLRRAEQRFSRFQPASELSLLNQQAGARVHVSRLLFRLTAASLAAAEATGGLFDPTVQRAMLAAGYVDSFERIGERRPASGAFAWEPGRFREVLLDESEQTIILPAGVGLDLGGIAKGWLADAVVRRLRRFGPAVVDIGGDCAFTPPGPGMAPWLIEIANPWAGKHSLAEIEQRRGGGVATSGVIRRRWWTADGQNHHVIDPRQGRPAKTDLASVTILGPSATAAEVMAKIILLLGRERGCAALAQRPRYAGLLVPMDGALIDVRTGHRPAPISTESV